ncbi:MAG: hypothetical protein A2156_10725 [Deltaproteobacteria bacterium RBG_16_48_10]|nr:MAG: hypothetical protein A2156_10725 [Deltaproteobacteria bacterium RBG_16_48_10]
MTDCLENNLRKSSKTLLSPRRERMKGRGTNFVLSTPTQPSPIKGGGEQCGIFILCGCRLRHDRGLYS